MPESYNAKDIDDRDESWCSCMRAPPLHASAKFPLRIVTATMQDNSHLDPMEWICKLIGTPVCTVGPDGMTHCHPTRGAWQRLR